MIALTAKKPYHQLTRRLKRVLAQRSGAPSTKYLALVTTSRPMTSLTAETPYHQKTRRLKRVLALRSGALSKKILALVTTRRPMTTLTAKNTLQPEDQAVEKNPRAAKRRSVRKHRAVSVNTGPFRKTPGRFRKHRAVSVNTRPLL